MFRAIEAQGVNRLRRNRIREVALLIALLGVGSSCDRMITQRTTQLIQDADAKAGEGNYQQAINLYETALDGSAGSAEVHYKLALLYDDKLNDPLNALHHFKRFLTLAPTGKRAEEVKNFMKRDELALLTNLSGDTMVTRSEAVRLQNENLRLRQQIEERWAQNKVAAAAGKPAARAAPVEKSQPNESRKRAAGKTRNYTVKQGDTLASISRKFYHSSGKWEKILQANSDTLSKPSDLKPGQKLVIP